MAPRLSYYYWPGFFFLCSTTGDITKNSFRFGTEFGEGANSFALRTVRVFLNNTPIEGLQMDSSHSGRDDYFRLFKLLNQDLTGGRPACSITFSEFMKGSAIYVFDFTASLNQTQEGVLPMVKTGSNRIEVTFDKGTTESIVMIALMEYLSVVSVDQHGTANIDVF